MKQALKTFFHQEYASGILILLATILALILSNSVLQQYYNNFLEIGVGLSVGTWEFKEPLLLWVNDGLMTLFFLHVGLGLKREMLIGALSKPANVILPTVAAFGGMIVPSVIFAIFNFHHEEYIRGWAIPMATDIAFAVGALSLLGKRIPLELKIFLLTLAIIDDIGAILVIAIFHTQALSWQSLIGSLLMIFILIFFTIRKINSLALYLIVGFILWIAVLKSGVHATLAGVVLGFLIPLQDPPRQSMLDDLEHNLHPWVAFIILPLFALTNAGVNISGVGFSELGSTLTLGIILGLFVGKPLGVMSFSWLLVKTKVVPFTDKFTWLQLFGVAFLCGIGFTMSLFIASLAYGDNMLILKMSRLGILLGSALSIMVGLIILNKKD